MEHWETQPPPVLIVMGSKSDLETMKPAQDVLKKFGIEHETRIASAHRAPEMVAELARGARSNGFAVIIAGAGLAAHLPGVIASHTTLPVIGVPLARGGLAGVDSLYSIVQMPPGVPVAAVGLDAARNAELFAVSIISVGHEAVASQLEHYREEMTQSVQAADNELQLQARRTQCESRTRTTAGAMP